MPFHFWTPDVYQGSPTPFTGYMAAVAKAAGFAGLLRVLIGAFPTQQANWRPIIWVIAVLTLLVGSVLALAQKDLKRMLAYSSISQAGYVLVGVQAASNAGTAGALFYLFTYTFIIIGSFAVVQLIEGPGEARNDLGAIRGLARRRPLLARRHAGVPAGPGGRAVYQRASSAKFYVVSAAVQRGQYPLAIIAMLAAAVAAFFYLRVALLMYSSGPDGAVEPAGAERAAAGDMSPGAAEGAPVTVGAAAPGAGAAGWGAAGLRVLGQRALGAAGVGAAGVGAAGVGAAGVGAAAPAEAGAGASPTAGARFTFNGGPRDGDGPVLDQPSPPAWRRYRGWTTRSRLGRRVGRPRLRRVRRFRLRRVRRPPPALGWRPLPPWRRRLKAVSPCRSWFR